MVPRRASIGSVKPGTVDGFCGQSEAKTVVFPGRVGAA